MIHRRFEGQDLEGKLWTEMGAAGSLTEIPDEERAIHVVGCGQHLLDRLQQDHARTHLRGAVRTTAMPVLEETGPRHGRRLEMEFSVVMFVELLHPGGTERSAMSNEVLGVEDGLRP